jgi:catechol 2,3-dioxygenase-like lactoylglutathione lyase family enzyme
MTKPKIRHLAMFAREPEKVAAFYQEVFDMELIDSYHNGAGNAQFVSDGYITIAILPHRLDGSAQVGLNHFGFLVEDSTEIRDKITKRGLVDPMKRPADRIYAEFRGLDPENNWFDISENGYDSRRPEADEIKRKKVPA